MPEFHFEVVEQGQVKGPAKVLTLPDGRAIWGCVEALALQLAGSEGAFIRVKDSRGGTVVRAGISTALASIKTCPCQSCPLKSKMKHFVATGRHSIPEHDLHVDCRLITPVLAA